MKDALDLAVDAVQALGVLAETYGAPWPKVVRVNPRVFGAVAQEIGHARGHNRPSERAWVLGAELIADPDA